MALTKTSLASPLTVDGLLLTATSATGATVGGVAMVDGEYMVITEITGTSIKVRSRGSFGGRAVAHVALAPLTFGLGSDFPEPSPGQNVPRPPSDPALISVSVDATFDPGVAGLNISKDTTVVITKASAWLQTITAPSQAVDGVKVSFVSATAYAHVITYTAGFSANTTSTDVATFAATFGAALTIVAQGGKWAALSSVGVTIG